MSISTRLIKTNMPDQKEVTVNDIATGFNSVGGFGKFIGYSGSSTGLVKSMRRLKEYADQYGNPIVVIFALEGNSNTNNFIDSLNSQDRVVLQMQNNLSNKGGPYNTNFGTTVYGKNARFGFFCGSTSSPADVKEARDFCIYCGCNQSSSVMAAAYRLKPAIEDHISVSGTISKSNITNYAQMTRIEIGQTVNRIAEDGFYGCTNLRTVSIPSNVQAIGQNAFAGCSSLQSIVFYGRSLDEVKLLANYPFGATESVIVASY